MTVAGELSVFLLIHTKSEMPRKQSAGTGRLFFVAVLPCLTVRQRCILWLCEPDERGDTERNGDMRRCIF